MSIKSRIKKWLDGDAPQERERVRIPLSRAAALAGRVSRDSEQSVLARGFGSLMEVAETSPEDDWRQFSLDSKTLDRISPSTLLKLLADLSPDVSKALWDFILFCNPGWECKVMRPGSDKVDERAQAVVDDFFKLLGSYHGTADVVFGRMFFSIFLRGSLLAELVLDKTGRLPVDLAVPDPASVKFERAEDDVRGEIFRMYQWQAGEKVYLDRPTIRYVPLHPFMGSPYGRPMVAPALFSTLFLLGLLHDLRRVISQQGYPRLDIEMQTAALKELMPSNLEDDPDAVLAWVSGAMTQFSEAYSELEPDDAYFHTDSIKVNRPVGTVDASSLGAMDGMIRALERMSTRALKSIPLLMGSNEATSETHANRQWEVHAAGIKSVQHSVETPLSELLEMMLQAQGIQASVEFRFAELRASEMQRDAITQGLVLQNAITKRDQGFISQDEAAMEGAGKEKAYAPAPVRTSEPEQEGEGQGSGMEPEPGSNRKRHAHRRAVEWEGLTLSRQPTELEARVLKPVAKAQESGKERVERVLMRARDLLVREAVTDIQGIEAGEYHTLILDTPAGTVADVTEAMRDVYKEGRELVAIEVGGEARAIEATHRIVTFGPNRIHVNEPRNGHRTSFVDLTDEDEIEEAARISVSRLVNDVQARAVDIATKAATLLTGAALLDKIQSDLSDTSTGYVTNNATGAANVALGLGRARELEERKDEIERYLWSSILDRNLCEQCEPLDGQEARTLGELPSAPYAFCLGGPLCRCFVIAVSK